MSRSNFSSNHAAIDRSGGAIAAMFPTADAHMFMYPAVIATNVHLLYFPRSTHRLFLVFDCIGLCLCCESVLLFP